MSITFDPTITLTGLINAGVLLIGFVGTLNRISGRIDLLAQRVKGVETMVKDTQGIDKRLTTIEERVTNHVNMLVQFQKEMGDLRKENHADMATVKHELAALRNGDWIKTGFNPHE
jgi:hypothetical protein